MTTLRRRYKGPTQAKRCQKPVPVPGSMIPAPCGDRVYKAGLCRDHWTDKRHASEARRGLPIVVQPWVKPEKAAPPTIQERRNRQGISAASQQWLIDRAAQRRVAR